MGKKAKKWRSRALGLEKGRASIAALKAALEKAKQDEMQALWKLNEANRVLGATKALNCFRTRIERMPFGRMGGDVYQVAASFDPRMIVYGLLDRAANGSAFNLSSHIRYMVAELASKIERELVNQLAAISPQL